MSDRHAKAKLLAIPLWGAAGGRGSCEGRWGQSSVTWAVLPTLLLSPLHPFWTVCLTSQGNSKDGKREVGLIWN